MTDETNITPDEDDTEGHHRRLLATDAPGTPEDTEGHVHLKAVEDEDDTAGHAYRF